MVNRGGILTTRSSQVYCQWVSVESPLGPGQRQQRCGGRGSIGSENVLGGEPIVGGKPTSQWEQLPGVKNAAPRKVGINPLGNWKRVVRAWPSIGGGSTEPPGRGGGTGVPAPRTT